MAITVTMPMAVKRAASVALDYSSKLRDIVKPLWKLLTLSPTDDSISAKKCLCVSIERECLSLGFGSRFLSRVTLKHMRRYPMELWSCPEPADAASTIALTVSDLKARRSEITLSIPKAWTVVKTAEFPSTVRESLPDVISYELDRITPFTSDEAFYDFRVLKDEGDKMKVLIMAAKSELITPYLDALSEKGLKVSRVTTGLSGLCTLCTHTLKRKNALLVEVRDNGYEGALCLDGALTTPFAGSFKSEDLAMRGDVLAGEIEPLITSSQWEGPPPEVIAFLYGDTVALKDVLKQRISAPLNVVGEGASELKIPVGSKGVSYAAAGGVVESLWPKAKGLNLLAKGRHERPGTPVALTILLLLVITGLWVYYAITPVSVEEKRLKEIDRQITLRKEEVRKVEARKKEIEALENEIATIESFKGGRPMALNVMKELTTILPKSAWLTRVRVTETTIEIEGYATTATELLPKLEASKLFQKVEFASPTFRDARLNSERFIIKAEIEGAKKIEAEKTKGEAPKGEKK